MSVSVYLTVACLSVREYIFGTKRPIFTEFLRALPMAVARTSSGSVAIRYVLPVYGLCHICPTWPVIGDAKNKYKCR